MSWKLTVSVPPHWPRTQVSEPQQHRNLLMGYLPISDKYQGTHHLHVAIQETLSSPVHLMSTSHPSPAFSFELVFQVTPKSMHLPQLEEHSRRHCRQAYWEVYFWLVCIKIFIQKNKTGRDTNSINSMKDKH